MIYSPKYTGDIIFKKKKLMEPSLSTLTNYEKDYDKIKLHPC